MHFTVKKALKNPLHAIMKEDPAVWDTPLAHRVDDWQGSDLDQGNVVTSEQENREKLFGRANSADRTRIANLMACDSTDSCTLIEPYRGELYLHCYRLLGSVHDAEDMVQETLFRAWRRFGTFKGEASLRTWLYTIATNVCLDALKKRSPRALPTTVYPEASALNLDERRTDESLWMEPFLDSWMGEATENPEVRYTRSESITLAFLTALQVLPPRQRAILILSDVLDWRALEVAQLLEISVAAVSSALHCARVTLAKHYPNDRQTMTLIARVDEEVQTLLSRYVQAWETDDYAGLVALPKEDAVLSMPPIALWFCGPRAIYDFLLTKFGGQKKLWRLYPISANGQPAFVIYRIDSSGRFYRASGIQVVTVDGTRLPRRIADITAFLGASLVTTFGFPSKLPT